MSDPNAKPAALSAAGGEESPDATLHRLFAERFGDDWRRDISLTLRADALYWLVHLAAAGLDAKSRAFRELPLAKRPAETAASLVTWRLDLEALVLKVKTVLNPPKKSNKGDE